MDPYSIIWLTYNNIIHHTYVGLAGLAHFQDYVKNTKRRRSNKAQHQEYTSISCLDRATRADLDNFVRGNGLPDDAEQLQPSKMYCVDGMIDVASHPTFDGTMAMAFISMQCVTWIKQVSVLNVH